MSTHGLWPNLTPESSIDEAPGRPLPVKVGVICAVLIALECVVVGVIYAVSARQWVPDATVGVSVSQHDVEVFRTVVMVSGVVGVVVAALLVIGAMRILAARRAWRIGVIVLLVLNAIFPNAIAVVDQTPILALLVIVDIVGIVCLAVPETSTWIKEHNESLHARSGK